MVRYFIVPLLILSFFKSGELQAQVSDLMAAGDSLYHLFDNRGAEAKYLEALNISIDNAEIYWRISRAQVDIGEHLPEAEQEAYFERAVTYADSAINIDPDNPSGHLRRAIALGKLALHKGVFKSVSLVKKVRESLERCLELDPDEPTAHYVLGRTHHKLCEKSKFGRKLLGLGWGNRAIADKEYLIAIELDGEFIMYRLDYAKLLIKMKRMEEAKAQLERIAEMPIRDQDDPDFKDEAAGLLEEEIFQ